jgi:hypothetical protein
MRRFAYRVVIGVLGIGLVATESGAANPRNVSPPVGANRYVKAIQANLGNVDLGCSDAYYKLCYQDAENRIAANVARKSPDVVFLEEVMPDWVCRNGAAGGSNKVCQNYQTRTVRGWGRC